MAALGFLWLCCRMATEWRIVQGVNIEMMKINEIQGVKRCESLFSVGLADWLDFRILRQ